MKKLNRLEVSLNNNRRSLTLIEDVKKEHEALFRIIFNVDHRLATSFNMILSSGIF